MLWFREKGLDIAILFQLQIYWNLPHLRAPRKVCRSGSWRQWQRWPWHRSRWARCSRWGSTGCPSSSGSDKPHPFCNGIFKIKGAWINDVTQKGEVSFVMLYEVVIKTPILRDRGGGWSKTPNLRDFIVDVP